MDKVMLELELEECERVIAEFEDEEIEQIMSDLNLSEEDARGVLQARELESMAKAFHRELALCVR